MKYRLIKQEPYCCVPRCLQTIFDRNNIKYDSQFEIAKELGFRNDEKYKGADSLKLLSEVCKLIENEGYIVCNVDTTVIAQKPKLAPFIEKMRENIADAMNVEVNRISVKATTEEKLGFTGEGLGISAHAVCLIEEKQASL